MTVPPVTYIRDLCMLSFNKFCLSIGAKWYVATEDIVLGLYSSGNGEYILKLRSPGSTCATLLLKCNGIGDHHCLNFIFIIIRLATL